MNKTIEHEMNAVEQECINACLESHRMCTEIVAYCLGMGGKHADPNHIRLLLDCAQICQTSADYMIRESPLHPMVCGICAQVCDLCAEDCESFDDSKMRGCASICRQCATACHSMAQVHA